MYKSLFAFLVCIKVCLFIRSFFTPDAFHFVHSAADGEFYLFFLFLFFLFFFFCIYLLPCLFSCHGDVFLKYWLCLFLFTAFTTPSPPFFFLVLFNLKSQIFIKWLHFAQLYEAFSGRWWINIVNGFMTFWVFIFSKIAWICSLLCSCGSPVVCEGLMLYVRIICCT